MHTLDQSPIALNESATLDQGGGSGMDWGLPDLNGIECSETDYRKRLFESVFFNANEGITLTNSQGCIVDVNPRFCEITGFSKAESVGQNPRILKSGRQGRLFYESMWRAIKTVGNWRGEIWNRNKIGEIYPEILSISAIKDGAGNDIFYVGIFTDISVIKANQARLEHLASHDTLTHLPNRVLLRDRLDVAIAQTLRNRSTLAVCFMDLDGFKPVNDSYGHALGDLLLTEVAKRLSIGVRAGDTVARIGGDEFVFLLGNLVSIEECSAALSRLLSQVSRPYLLKGNTVRITASIGVTLYPRDDADADTLIRHADQALYFAKNSGRNRIVFFDHAPEQVARSKRDYLEQFLDALTQGQLHLHYQPKVHMGTGAVFGVEALIRWQHPELGLLSPASFLPSIENTFADIALGQWVINEALRQAHQWHDSGRAITISINISAYHLTQTGFVAFLKTALDAFPDLPIKVLEIEILETAAFEDIGQIIALISECNALGVEFAIDDFGTGYSSLSYLKRLPVTTLKIDQTFIRDMIQNPEDIAIVEGIISLARAFRRNVVAEGVETVEHGLLLLQKGCPLAQGYAIARPMSSADFEQWAGHWGNEALWKEACRLDLARIDPALLLFDNSLENWWNDMESKLTNGASLAHSGVDPRHVFSRYQRWFEREGTDRYGGLDAFESIKRDLMELIDAGGALLDTGFQATGICSARTMKIRELVGSIKEKLGRFMATSAVP